MDSADAVDRSEMNRLIQDAYRLSEAYRFKQIANIRYSQKNYSSAVYWYHQSLLRARAIQQLSQYDLRDLARFERDTDDSEDGEEAESTEGSSKVVVADSNSEQTSLGEKVGERRKRISSTSRGEEMKMEAMDITIKCYNNLAACILKGQNRTESDFLRAVDYCDKVLLMEPSNEKAIYRKGLALFKANMHEKAIEVLKKCSCSNSEAQAVIVECQRLLNEERRRRDDQVRRNFARLYGVQINGQPVQQEMNDGAGSHPISMNGNANVNANPFSEQQPH